MQGKGRHSRCPCTLYGESFNRSDAPKLRANNRIDRAKFINASAKQNESAAGPKAATLKFNNRTLYLAPEPMVELMMKHPDCHHE